MADYDVKVDNKSDNKNLGAITTNYINDYIDKHILPSLINIARHGRFSARWYYKAQNKFPYNDKTSLKIAKDYLKSLGLKLTEKRDTSKSCWGWWCCSCCSAECCNVEPYLLLEWTPGTLLIAGANDINNKTPIKASNYNATTKDPKMASRDIATSALTIPANFIFPPTAPPPPYS